MVVYSSININSPTELESHSNEFLEYFCGIIRPGGDSPLANFISVGENSIQH